MTKAHINTTLARPCWNTVHWSRVCFPDSRYGDAGVVLDDA
jgi:hypothetical protein